ncbi:MAG TPA: diguanylate cyclase, partial [Tepidisphaeraceae bacterium]|nr:diguanylate cyclase [Tepidisphaeraceae bacterium]
SFIWRQEEPRIRAVAKRIREEFADASAKLIGREKGLTMSVGIGSLHGSQSTTADELIASADSALYTAKEAGRDRIHLAPETRRLAAV